MLRNRSVSAVLVALLWSGCVYPTERSGELQVEMDPVPAFRQGEIDTLTARVVTAAGVVVPDAQIVFQSSNQTVLVVQPSGELQATGAGISVVTARVIGFENAGLAEQVVTVKPAIVIDSIRPLSAMYGETVRFHGVGLDKDSIVLISMGEGSVPPYYTWTPVDPNKPHGFGALDVWVAPPAPVRSGVVVVAFGGVVFGPDTINVTRRDILEPNDTIPRNLGALPDGFFNPALAFEQRLREIGGADWYRFNQTAAGDRTIFVLSRQLTNEAFTVVVAQQDVLAPSADGNFEIVRSGWAVGGPGIQVCKGFGFQFAHLAGPSVVASFKGLAAGTYDIIAQGAPGAYELLIVNQYISSRVADPDEENDNCELAKPLVAGQTKQLTIDNPHDPDWFSYRPQANESARFQVTLSGDGPGFLDPDLDIFVFRETADSIVPIAEGTTSGDNETDVAVVNVQAGVNYLILVTDYAGVPTRYQLTMTTTPAPSNTQPDFFQYREGGKIRRGVSVTPKKLVARP